MLMDKNKTGNLIREARTLATVLDVHIQDIITGNTEVNDDYVIAKIEENTKVNDDGVVDANNTIHFD